MRTELYLCVFLGICALNAIAQTDVEEVIVTGARTSSEISAGFLGNRSLIETPLSATGYTSALILDQGARSTSEVLANDPSVRVQSAGDGVYDYFSLRGFSISAAAFSLNGLYGVLPWNTMSPEAVEQFEVIRGPATTLAGASPMDNSGGAINIHPKRAGDEALTRVTTAFDGGGQAGIHADVGRRLGNANQWGLRTNLVYRDGELAREDQFEKTELITIGADYREEGFSWMLDAGYQDLSTEGTPFLIYIYPETVVPQAPETDKNISPKWAHSTSQDQYLATRAEWDISDSLGVYAAVGARDHESLILNPYSEIADDDGNLTVYPYQEAYSADTKWSAEIGSRWSFKTSFIDHALVASASGIEFSTGWLGTYSEGFEAMPDYASNLYHPNDEYFPSVANAPTEAVTQVNNKLTGLSLIDTLSVQDGKYQLLLGIRHQKYNVERLYEMDNRYYNQTAWSPSVALLTRLNESTSVYINYMTGLSQGPFAPIGTENQNQAFNPIKSKQVESGIKFKQEFFSANLALFQITQPAGLTNPDTNIFSLDGEQQHRGIELTFDGRVATDFRILGGINYLNAELTKTEVREWSGNHAPGVPAFTANLGGEWDIPWLSGAALTARVTHTDKQYLYGDNVQSIPSWSRYDAGARYTFDFQSQPIVLRLNLTNITGENYWASAKGSGLTVGAPRSILFSVSVDL